MIAVPAGAWLLQHLTPQKSAQLLTSKQHMHQEYPKTWDNHVATVYDFHLYANKLSHLSPSNWGSLREPKENYAGSGTWISFLHSFLSSNMPSLIPLASISCRITSIHVFFGLLSALLTCSNLICSTRWTDASVGLLRTWPNHRRRFSLIFFFIVSTPILVQIFSLLILSLCVLSHIQRSMRISATLIFCA